MGKRYTSVNDLAMAVAQTPSLEEAIKANPAEAIANLAERPLDTDVWIYRMVVGALGLTLLVALIGGIVLAATSKDASNTLNLLTALGSAAVGALAGLLAPSPRQTPAQP